MLIQNIYCMKNSEINLIFDKEKVNIFKDKEFIREFNSLVDFLFWLYNNRCIMRGCFNPAGVIHEIEPRSSGKDSLFWKNRVTLCNTCHRRIHDSGINDKTIKELREIRVEYLEMIGKSEYE